MLFGLPITRFLPPPAPLRHLLPTPPFHPLSAHHHLLIPSLLLQSCPPRLPTPPYPSPFPAFVSLLFLLFPYLLPSPFLHLPSLLSFRLPLFSLLFFPSVLSYLSLARADLLQVPLEHYFPEYTGSPDINKAAKYVWARQRTSARTGRAAGW
ncbi:hypothetical protein B0H14DRAFT_3614800 [Mycena olivaceomarginata]|nr:hypothetical protein B0H14DRAFT_3614800 [Mycena olivaceomarginata]